MNSRTLGQPNLRELPETDYKLYELLIDLMKYDHARTHDNFKLFLTVNSIFVAVIGYLLRGISKIDPQALSDYHKAVLYFICIVSILGMIMAVYCWLLVKRIGFDAQLRYFHLREIEQKNRSQFFITHFLMGYSFFFKGKEPESLFVYPDRLPYSIPKPPNRLFREGTRAIWAYAAVNFGFVLLYYCFFVGSCTVLSLNVWLCLLVPVMTFALWILIVFLYTRWKDKRMDEVKR